MFGRPVSPARRDLKWSLAFVIVVLGWALRSLAQEAAPRPVAAQGENASRDLTVGAPIERALGGGQQHEYRVTLAADQALRAVVDQRGIDVVVKVFAPDGRSVAEVDSPNGDRGPEPVFVVAARAGIYRVVVQALEATAPSGRYEIVLADVTNAVGLTPGQPVDRPLGGGMADAFLIDATAGQFVALTVEQMGSDLEAVFDGPDGGRLALRDDPDGALVREERLSVVAPTTGRYHIVVRSEAAAGAKGRYRLTLGALRNATQADRAAAEAEATQSEGERLRGLARSVGTAVERYDVAIQRWRALNLPDRLYVALMLQADALVALDRFQPATTAVDEALTLSTALGDRLGQSRALLKSGVVLAKTGRPQDALERFQRALAIASADRLVAIEVVLLNNIGQIHSEAGRFADALPFLERALGSARETGEPGAIFSATNNLAGVNHETGNYQAALDGYRDALRMSRDTQQLSDEVIVLNNLGTVYNDLGQRDVAIDHHRQSLALARRIEDVRGQATALTNIASLEISQGRPAEALKDYQEALVLRRKSQDVAGEAGTLYNMGNLSNEPLRDYPQAIDYLSQAAAILRRLDSRANLAIVLGTTAKVYFRMGDQARALDTFRQSSAISHEIGDRRSESITLQLIGVSLREMGDLRGARAAIEESLGIKESLRRSVAVSALRTSFFASMRDSYDVYIDLLMRLHETESSAGNDRLALEVAERARARTLLDTVVAGRVDLEAGMDASLLARRRDGQGAVSAAASRLAAAQRGRRSVEDVAVAEREVNAAFAALADVEAAIKRSSPDYASLVQPDPISADAIQRTVVDADSVLLEFSVGSDRSVLWVVTPDRITATSLPKQAELQPLVRRYRELLLARVASVPGESASQFRARIEAADRDAVQIGESLSRMLLLPARDVIRGKRILIVPDGTLEGLPFAALPSPEESGADRPPLIVAHEVAILPSASTVVALRSRTGRATPATKTIAVIADPVFTLSDSRVASAARRPAATATPPAGDDLSRAASDAGIGGPSGALPRLPYARTEADTILSMVPSGATTRLLNFDASVANATGGALRGHRIVHIATHAFANDEHPELSGIVLSLVGRDGKPVDGFLRLHQIYNLDLSAVELAVLSACQTAMGRDVAGEGVVGLTRGFLHAGASSVVSSLWAVSDQSTSELMKTFYGGMLGRQGLTKSAALRAAQIALWQQPRWRAPYYWAAFELFGDWR